MDWFALACPHCGHRSRFLINKSCAEFLRACPDCNRWLVGQQRRADSEETFSLTSLSDPPRCPIEGCDEVLQPDALPPHIIEDHEETPFDL